ncbi:MAG: hybrid sensor histidine kinase/response regulator [Alkalinema sp. RU_4_3]|nr:hybrid sensor histidine kinase/response regulator [Alkalinema sp. RU_4_3]
MDTEQQVRISFLEEAEEYFEQLESVLLDLATTDQKRSQLDLALRAAHSLKGSAGMMGFMALSRVAHGLEDCFKILRARDMELDQELETLLLAGVDALRSITAQYRSPETVADEVLIQQAMPILGGLRDRLGEVTDADETVLLADNENMDVGLLIFSNGVEETLNEFIANRIHLRGAALQQALIATSQKLLEFGLVGDIEPFTVLCESVQTVARGPAALNNITAIADRALEVWQRSHSLVEIGRADQISTTFEPPIDAPIIDLAALQNTIAQIEVPKPPEIDLTALQATIAQIEVPQTPEIDLAALQATIAQIEIPKIEIPVEKPTPQPKKQSKAQSGQDATIRVSVEQIKQINTLLGTLILDRNAVNLRCQQLQQSMGLMRERMRDLDKYNSELKQWYDRASLERLVPDQREFALAGTGKTTEVEEFDTLEMDQYSGLHLMAQSQMETIVKLSETLGDLDLATQEIQQANGSLNYTSRSLQSRFTRLQMRPFSEVVNRLPRVMRDLSVKYGKQVDLHIEGGTTLFERFALDVLADPINHLLRNAFDHGIESPAQRLASGKPATGNITLTAAQQGNLAILKITDDGQGINLDRIRQKLSEHGLPQPQIAAFTEAELLEFIFDAGFSTAKTVTELSGRGVGMDVVRTNLATIQGQIEVTTKPGLGSTFTITVPLNLSIFRVMLLESQGFLFACGLDMVKAVLPLKPEDDLTKLHWNDQQIDLIAPHRYWQFSNDRRPNPIPGKPIIDHPLVVVVKGSDRHYGILVDRYWSEQEVSVRPIATRIPLPTGFAGVTMLGDGRIVPLVDVANLFSSEQIKTAVTTTVETQRQTVLVVDDSVHARRYLALSLEKAGYYVEQAKDGQEAVDRLLGGLRVQAVVCDVEMPRLDGYGVLGEIKSKSEFASLPIVMLTSRTNEKHRRLAINLGASDYFSKPYNEVDLLDRLAVLIQGNP